MTRISLAAITAAALLSFSMPAFAQMNMPMKPATSGTAVKAGTPATGNTAALKDSDSMPATCQGMMDKAHPMMSNMASGNKKRMAMKQMHMADIAMRSGKEKSCMNNMKRAMHDMM